MKHRVNSINKVGLVNSDGHVIGLDLGATAVRAAALAPGLHEGRPSVSVHGLGAVPLPPGSVTCGAVTNPGAVTAAIRQLWATAKLKDTKVVLGIASQQVVVRDLTMPDMPAEQIRAALPFQARDVIALPLEQALIDFCPLGPAGPNGTGIPGLLIAMPRKPVITAVEAVEKAGLQVARVDLAAFAALRSTAGDPGAVEMVVDIGAQLSTVVIHRAGAPKVVRIIAQGSDAVTEGLADRGSMPVEEAEAAKRTIGVGDASTGDSSIARIVRDLVRPLMSEVRGSAQFYNSTNADAPIGRIALTGGGAAMPGLANSLAEQHGVPASVVTPMQHIRNRFFGQGGDAEGDENAATAVSIGLAMGAAA